MHTNFRMKQPFADIFLKCAREFCCNSPVRPERFIQVMKNHQGSIGMITGKGMDAEGLEYKNPVIVALGDSVTAGHFESLLPKDPELLKAMMEQAFEGRNSEETVAIEISDARESYVEKFRGKLIDQYELTSVSTINAGIAGDHLISMAARANRDVIRYDPDLVLINGALNWGDDLGTTQEYKEILQTLVKKIKKETQADIILLTPNGDLPNTLFGTTDLPALRTAERAAVIREIASEEQVCLADVYAVWEQAREQGCPWEEMLANGVNHPSVEGHEVYAQILMKLFE